MSHKDNADLLRRVASDLVETDAPKREITMNAAEARTSADNYIKGLHKAHARWRKNYDTEQARLLTKRKQERWASLIPEIEALVKKSAMSGGRSLPLADIFYFKPEDAILLPAVKHHLESNGFTVEEYLYDGLMLSW